MGSVLDPVALRADIEDARELLQRGSPAGSRRRFRSILAQISRADDPRAEISAHHARLLLGLALAEFELTGDFALAEGLLGEAMSRARESGADELTASIHGQRGLLLLRRGDTTAALAALDEAVRSFDSAPAYDRMTLLLNRGTVHLDRGDVDAAAADYARCVAIAREEGERLLEWKARHNQGYAEFLAGRLPRALAALDEAERINPGAPSPIAMLDRARVLREAGLVRDADTLLAQAGELLLGERLYQDVAETEMVRAECALVEGDPQRARALAVQAHQRFARRGNVRWQRRAELLRLLSERALAEERGPRARRTALLRVAESAEELERHCRREGRTDLGRSAALVAVDARLRAGLRLDEAGAGTSTARLRAGDPLGMRLRTREVRARAALNAGALARAAAEVRAGLAELGGYQLALGSLDLRTASAVHGTALTRVGLDVALSSGRPSAVLQLVEQARALSTRLPRVVPPEDPRAAELLRELRAVEEEARQLEGDPAAVTALGELRTTAAGLQRVLRERSWKVEGGDGDIQDAPRLGELQEAVRRTGSRFVTFARHDGWWVAVVADGRRARLLDLAPIAEVRSLLQRVRADLDALARPVLPGSLRGVVRRSLVSGLDQLDEWLVKPLGADGTPLVLSCSGDLVFLPWGLLPSRLGTATTVTPSAAGWLRGAGRARPDTPKVAAISGPGLRRADDEVAEVQAVWSTRKATEPGQPEAETLVLRGAGATADATKQTLLRSDLVHVAAHGTHRQDSPLFSSLRLSDGFLYAHELEDAVGLAGCVVMSSCEAGLATIRPGDESLGLTHVLLQFGVRSVIAGIARVNDDAAADLMGRVHRSIALGTDSAQALAEAQKDALEADSPAGLTSFGSAW